MALTKEIIKANAALSALTDEQLNALVEMSANDENDVLGKRFGEVYRTMDATIETSTGIKRNGDEKTYDYLKRAASELKKQTEGASKFEDEIKALKADKERLEALVKSGNGNEELKAQLEQKDKEIANVQKMYAELKKDNERQKSDYEQKLFGVQLDNDLRGATGNLKLKAEIPEAAARVLMQQALDKVKGFAPKYIDNGNNGKVLAFHNEDGSVMRNEATNLKPYTAAELVEKQLNEMGVLAPKAQGGGGTVPPAGRSGGNGGGVTIDLSAARTRKEFTEIATKTLLEKGLMRGTDEFDTALQEIYKTNEGYSDLPLQ